MTKTKKLTIKTKNNLANIIEKVNGITQIGNERYFNRKGWQALTQYYGYRIRTEKTERLPNGYIAGVIIYDKKGRVIGETEGICLRNESNWHNKPDFYLRSITEGRARSKAFRMVKALLEQC